MIFQKEPSNRLSKRFACNQSTLYRPHKASTENIDLFILKRYTIKVKTFCSIVLLFDKNVA